MKKVVKIVLLIIISFMCSFPVYAKEVNMENVILLDVARHYYTVDEIKSIIDGLSKYDNSSLQLHLSDDENVGIECNYLDQTVGNATLNNGIYTNSKTGKKFLSYSQINEIINYAKQRNVEIIPEIDVPAHMNGFFKLAILKFGEEYVKTRYNHDNPNNSGIAWGSGSEEGNIDLMSPNAKPFIKNILDEYTDAFKELKYFHIGFDEYTFRPEMKIDYINELYTYISSKGFTMRMWNDAITNENIDNLISNNIQITYWGSKEDDIYSTNYATVPDFQNRGFKVIISNKHYLFFVPSANSTSAENLAYAINDISNNWDLNKWNYTFNNPLENYNNILGAMVCVWGEEANNLNNSIIISHSLNMHKTMVSKMPKITVPDTYENGTQKYENIPDTAKFNKGITIAAGIILFVFGIVFTIYGLKRRTIE